MNTDSYGVGNVARGALGTARNQHDLSKGIVAAATPTLGNAVIVVGGATGTASAVTDSQRA